MSKLPEHWHWSDQKCDVSCDFYGKGTWSRVYTWPEPSPSKDMTDAIRDARDKLTEARRLIEDTIGKTSNPDMIRSLGDSKGCVQAAIVLLYSDLETLTRQTRLYDELLEEKPR